MKKILIAILIFVVLGVGVFITLSNNPDLLDKINDKLFDEQKEEVVIIPTPPVIPENMNKDEFSYVYSAISLDLLSLGYDVFNAVAKTENCYEYGLGFCDYTEGYQFDFQDKTYLSSGFLSFSSNNMSKINCLDTTYIIPIDDNLNEVDTEGIGYIVDFVENGIPNGHFILNNKYVKYNVSDGNVNIDSLENKTESYDLSIGSIYNYDKNEYQFIPYDEISSGPIEYIPLTDKIDAQELKESLYSIIDEQEKNGYNFESITIAHISFETLNALRGLLSQKDTLNGYSFEYLDSIEYDNASQYLYFNGDGSLTIKDLPPMSSENVKNIMDWIVDGLVLVGSAAIAVVSVTFLGPAGGVIAAGVIGGGIQYFSETVIQGKKFNEVNWAKVGIMAISGAIGAVVPCTGFSGYVAVGALGGLTSAAMTAVDGGSWEEILDSGIKGALTSVVMHGLFGSCFPAGTQVLTRCGLMPIENITIGMYVASYNLYTNKTEYKEVLNTYNSFNSNLTKIYLENGDEIVSTQNHPYYDLTRNKYVAASELTDESILIDEKHNKIYISKVINLVNEDVVLYNLNVEDNHNYFVSNSIVLVHNKCVDAARNKAGQSARQEAIDDVLEGNWRKWGLNPDNKEDLKIIKFVQENKRWPSYFKGDGIQVEFAHAVDVSNIRKAFLDGKITESQYIEFISSPNNGLLTSNDVHFNILHSGNYKNSTNYEIAIQMRPSIAEYVKKILEEINKGV